jgi:transposase InsO family protein
MNPLPHVHAIQLIEDMAIRPAKPTDNPFIESFNGNLREERLRQHWFNDIEGTRRVIEKWRKEYNLERPHPLLAGANTSGI